MTEAAPLVAPQIVPRIAFVGESLIDFTALDGDLRFQGHVGGSLANSAVAAARLGQPTGFVSQLSTDFFGERLLANLRGNGIDTTQVLRSPAPSTLAFVQRSATANQYAFYMQGTADTLWAPQELPQLPAQCRWLHFGSISLLHEPAASRILEFVQAQRGQRLVLFDPNARPSLVRDAEAWRSRCRQCMQASDVVKLSDEDLALLSPGTGAAQAVAAFLALGSKAVVLTRGTHGATLYRAEQEPLSVPAPSVQVVDTIGAGDTFAAGLSVALLERGVGDAQALAALPPQGMQGWEGVLRFAAMAAALNCAREGADPPRRAEVDAALAQASAGG